MRPLGPRTRLKRHPQREISAGGTGERGGLSPPRAWQGAKSKGRAIFPASFWRLRCATLGRVIADDQLRSPPHVEEMFTFQAFIL